MTNPLSSTTPEQSSNRVNNIIADLFTAATITIAGFLAVLTVAATV